VKEKQEEMKIRSERIGELCEKLALNVFPKIS
jgi:hypothetical protein